MDFKSGASCDWSRERFTLDEKYWIAQDMNEAMLLSSLQEENLIQEEDTLDTWFLSSLWPFASLGWPEKTEDYNKFYPASIIETADDIIFFWCARMLMMGRLCTKQWAFNKIYLHGIIRDKNGIKMAKGLGNGIDPIEMIKEYGCDALRWTLASQCNAGHDTKINPQDIATSLKFMNKIWNASKFMTNHTERMNINEEDSIILNWEPLIQLEKNYHQYLKKEMFLQASQELQYFFKHTFCDEWIEENKQKLYDDNKDTAKLGLSILRRLLMLMHPFIPFITEKIFSQISERLLIMEKY